MRDRPYRYCFCLSIEHLRVPAVLGHELLVTPLLDKLSLLQNENVIGHAHGGEAMGDEDSRAV